MSPARARTSTAEIVAAGREILEAGGLEAVTMQAVAERVGVKAPSLYKRYANRGALIAALGDATVDELRRLIEPLGSEPDPVAGIRAVAAAFRGFAHRRPRAYELLFMNLPPDFRASADVNALGAQPLLELTTRLVGADRALEAARLLTAFAHGFVSMELSGAFRLGGDVDDAYTYGVEVLAHALAGERTTRDRASRRR